MLATRGLWGRPARHFDFGWQLRQAVTWAAAEAGLSAEESQFLRQVLDRGLLLEDEHFDIAARILRTFLDADGSPGPAWIVLNGMPRHVGQARAVEPIIRVTAVIELDCSAEVVRKRIASNIGGDRAGRGDDAPAAVEQPETALAAFDRAIELAPADAIGCATMALKRASAGL